MYKNIINYFISIYADEVTANWCQLTTNKRAQEQRKCTETRNFFLNI